MSIRNYDAVKSVQDTPFGYTLSVISGKWKMTILYWLVEICKWGEMNQPKEALSGSSSGRIAKHQESDTGPGDQ